jgi:DNA-binding CsgD family transcriptional regulator
MLRVGSDALLVLSFPIPADDVLKSLTAAEREVVALVASGATNPDIAHRRGVSKHTVAKQITAVFRKVKVTSRFELIAVLSGASSLSSR